MAPRRSGFWSSVKRALGGAEPEETRDAPAFLDLVVPSPAAPSPAAPLPARAEERDPPFLSREEPKAQPPQAARSPLPKAVESPPPPEAVIEAAPGIPPSPAPPATEAPGLARNLASFSSRNSERGKRFAHLLKDSPPPEKPARGSDRRH